MVESADTRDLKSLGSNTVPVQVRSAAPYRVFITDLNIPCEHSISFCFIMLLVDKKMGKADLRKVIGVSLNTITKMNKNKEVALSTLTVIPEQVVKSLFMIFPWQV